MIQIAGLEDVQAVLDGQTRSDDQKTVPKFHECSPDCALDEYRREALPSIYVRVFMTCHELQRQRQHFSHPAHRQIHR